jgi:glycosyltransferase involved in cell wall biosynthesis
MEALARLVGDALEQVGPTTRITLGHSQRHLLWFLPWAAVRLAVRLLRGGVRQVVCGDPVVLVALVPVLWIRGPEVAVFVHGLDLVYPNALYRAMVRRALRRADTVLAISAATRAEASRLGVPDSRLVTVLPAAEAPLPPTATRSERRHALCRRLGIDVDHHVVVTVGRLVPRKGARWFVEQVVPLLPETTHYVVAGSGPDLEAVLEVVTAHRLGRRVHVLGPVDEPLREALLGAADVFAMPNVPVPGDMEGFGLVAVEAAMRATPVVAARLEGIADAVAEGETGVLCDPGDAPAFAKAIGDLLDLTPVEREALGERFAAEAARRFGVDRLAQVVATALG